MCPCLLSWLFLCNDTPAALCKGAFVLRTLDFTRFVIYHTCVCGRMYDGFHYVNVLFPCIVVPGRVELPTSTLSV